jgi:YidC/Oxa1 family membrane protein insertase
MDKKNFFAIALITVVVIIWMIWQGSVSERPVPPKVEQESVSEEIKTDTANTIDNLSSNKDSLVSQQKYGKTFSPFSKGQERIITIENNYFSAEISSKGAGIKSWQLKEYKKWDGIPVQLIWEDKGELFLEFVTFEGVKVDSRDLYFESGAGKDKYVLGENDSVSFKYELKVDENKSIIKEYTFYGNSYSFDSEITLQNMQDIIPSRGYDYVWANGLRYQEYNSVDESQSAEAVVQLNGTSAEIDASSIGEKEMSSETGIVDYAAVKIKYFAAAIIPAPWQSFDGTVDVVGQKFAAKNDGEVEKYDVSFRVPYQTGTDTKKFKIYIGPLEYDRVSEYGLQNIVDFGWKYGIRQIGEYFMLPIFTFIHKFVPNYGIALIIFSIIIKILLYPLSIQQMRSASKMKLLAPEMQAIRDKYKDDNQKQQREIMNMYSQYGVNPVGGCLPMLLQMPILFSLWSVLRSAIELRQSEFFWWITDLSTPDKVLEFGFSFLGISHLSGLALLMGVTMFFQQKLTITDPRQKSMVYFMPVFFVFLFSNFPAGLNLYYFMFNLLGIVQQVYINKFSKNKPTLDKMKQSPKKESWLQKKMREAQEIAEAQGKGVPGKSTPNPNQRKKRPNNRKPNKK